MLDALKTKKNNAVIIYLLITSSFFVFTSCIILSQMDWLTTDNKAVSIISVAKAFDVFFLEYILLLIVGGWLIQQQAVARIAAYLISFSVFTINAIQTISYYQTGEFISRLAIENINHAAFVTNTENSSLVLLIILFFLSFIYLIEKQKSIKTHNSSRNNFAFLALTLTFAAISYTDIYDLWPNDTTKESISFLYKNKLKHHSPSRALYDSAFSRPLTTADTLSASNIDTAKKYGFHFAEDALFPLIKDSIYKGESPFELKAEKHDKFSQPNIIVFFTEGFSARTSNVYGSEYSNLTPNLLDFSKQSMIISNYYNHTAASYRGIHGQLCSIYPANGGGNGWGKNNSEAFLTNYFCLSHLFNNYNYKTIFLTAERLNQTYLDEMMAGLEFDEIWTADNLEEKHYFDSTLDKSKNMSDQQLFNGLINLLKAIETSDNTNNQPFFMNIYNIETHAWIDISEDGKPYGKADNLALNTIHNFDDAFGKFWKYFQQSPLAENTIVIFTSDHAHYHEKPYVDAVDKPGQGYQKLFIDKIPFVIYDSSRNLPKTYDANFSSSIDFAPSLIHYLNLVNHENAFMGGSIFDKNRSNNSTSVASVSNRIHLIKSDKIHTVFNTVNSPDDFLNLYEYILYTKNLEKSNQLWDSRLNATIKSRINEFLKIEQQKLILLVKTLP